MAGRRSTAASVTRTEAGLERAGPVRTCIGCRTTAAAAELFRVVVARTSPAIAASHDDHRDTDHGSAAVVVVPDPDRSAPGRGAWLHPNLSCAEQAQRRRAFARALRVPGPVDAAPVLAHLTRTLD